MLFCFLKFKVNDKEMLEKLVKEWTEEKKVHIFNVRLLEFTDEKFCVWNNEMKHNSLKI